MEKFDRVQKLHRLLMSHKRPLSLSKMEDELECTGKTVKRTIDILRDYLCAPLEYDPQAKGWYYRDEKFELPGLWLTAEELQSLVALLHILHSMEQGLIGSELDVIKASITNLLSNRGIAIDTFTQRIKFLPMAKQLVRSQIFTHICDALLNRKQITINYQDSKGKQSRRNISPQTLAYYREAWYLDAWCHNRSNLRTFMVPRIQQIWTTEEPAKKIPEEDLQAHFASAYGIFAGAATRTAKLKFHPEIAHTIKSQQWHPEQISEWEGEYYLLSLPYGDDRELVLDILHYGEHVEVLAPPELREAVIARLKSALGMYEVLDV